MKKNHTIYLSPHCRIQQYYLFIKLKYVLIKDSFICNFITFAGSSPPSDTYRNHSKLKRFLSTLVQFSGQISPQTSDRVKGQIFTLVVSTIVYIKINYTLQVLLKLALSSLTTPSRYALFIFIEILSQATFIWHFSNHFNRTKKTTQS